MATRNDQTLPLEECIICFYPLEDRSVVVTECGHVYHHECVRKWFNLGMDKRCPLCNVGKKIEKGYTKKTRWCCCFWF